MKKLITLLLTSVITISVEAQTYQNNTATTAVDGLNVKGGCGMNTDYAIQMSDISVPITGTVSDPSKITVNVAITNNYAGDVAVDLVAPDGDVITLIKRLGASSNTSCGSGAIYTAANILSFNSANSTQITGSTGVSIASGNYAPTGSATIYPLHKLGSMSTFFNGKSIYGTWRLMIYDYGVGDTTTLNSWSISFASGALLRTSEAGIFGNIVSIKENPVKDNLLLSLNKKNFKKMNLQIFDLSGKLIKSVDFENGNAEATLDVSALKSGAYLLLPIVDGEKTQALKFIKK